jgi:hypothetical protein
MDLVLLSIQLAIATKSLLAAFDETPERRSRAVVAQDASAETKLAADNTIRLCRNTTRSNARPPGSGSVRVGSLTRRRFNQ